MGSSLRTRYNFQGGQILDNPLAAASTTSTSTAYAGLPAIDGAAPEYVAITLDPDGLEGPPEIAWVTAHVAGSSSVTLLRAQEGTAARLHYQDTPWVHAPTSADVGATEADLVMVRAQPHFGHTGTGTSIRRWDGTNVGWDPLTYNGFAHSGSIFTTGGYQDIFQPPAGTVIPGVAGAASVTAVTAGVPLTAWQNLWYEVPPNGTGASSASQFRVGAFTGGWVVPKNYLFICKRNGSDGRIQWADGQVQDFWRNPTFQNGWVNYSDPNWAPCQYRKDGNRVTIRGMVSTGTNNSTVFTLPVGYRPATPGSHFISVAADAPAMIRLFPGGEVQMYRFAGAGAWYSMDCSFVAGA